MAARGGDLDTVKSFDEVTDVIAIKDNQEVNVQCVHGYLDLDFLDPHYQDTKSRK